MKVLIENGAEIDAKDFELGTPLHSAVFFGQTNAVRFLIEMGADVNAEEENDNMPIHEATIQGCFIVN